ncbi:hypothetical protein JTY60_02300 [symbiont of Argiope bruennichi]|uniref:septation ring formation regulator EzrA n=1 Tax=symbiont of Argiope bruennichi TaxID=2810479 RepID=UPI003DA25873
MNTKLLIITISLIIILAIVAIVFILYFYVCNFYYKIIKKSKQITAVPYRQKLKKLAKISEYNLNYLSVYQENLAMFNHIKNNYLIYLAKDIDVLNKIFKKKNFFLLWKSCKKISVILKEIEDQLNVLSSKINSSFVEEENFRLEINRYKEAYQKLNNFFRKNFLKFEIANEAINNLNSEIEDLFANSEKLLKVSNFEQLKEHLSQLNYYLTFLLDVLNKLPFYYNLLNIIIPKKLASIKKEYTELISLNLNLNNVNFQTINQEIEEKVSILNKKLAYLDINGINFDILSIFQKINEVKKTISKEKLYFDFVFVFAKKIDQLILKIQKKRIKNNSKINAIFSFYELNEKEKLIFINSRNYWDQLLITFENFKSSLQKKYNSWSNFAPIIEKLLEQIVQSYNFIVIESKFLLSLKSIDYYKQELIKLKNLLFEIKAKELDDQFSPFFDEYLDNLNIYLKDIKNLYNFLFQQDKKINFIIFQEKFEILSTKVIEIVYKFKVFSDSIQNTEKFINIANKFRNLSEANETDISKAEYLFKIKNYDMAKKLALYVIKKNDQSLAKNLEQE